MNKLPCGHDEASRYKTTFNGKTKTYCFSCLFEKVGILPFEEQKEEKE